MVLMWIHTYLSSIESFCVVEEGGTRTTPERQCGDLSKNTVRRDETCDLNRRLRGRLQKTGE
jgi:hypothetical protein